MNMVDLHGNRLALDSEAGRRLVTDLCRFAEGILDEKTVKRRYPLDAATWERLGSDDALVEVIEVEKARRIRSGETKRERAQQLVTQAPDVLGGIMLDDRASPRHRVDAIKTLDGLAVNGPDAAATPTTFRISINLGTHTEVYEKQLTASPNPTSQELPPWGTSFDD
jgi:hypothetical protein